MGAPDPATPPTGDLATDMANAEKNNAVVAGGPLRKTPLSWSDIVTVVRKPFLKVRRTELYPFVGTTMAGMQLAQIVHGLISVVLIAVMIAHIYIGSLGMEGAFDAMGSGEVDLNWAKAHHGLWVEEEQARERAAAAGRTAAPAE